MNTPLTPREELEIKITALLMGQLPPEEAAALETQIAADPELAKLRARLGRAVELLRAARDLPDPTAAPLQLSKERRDALLARFRGIKAVPSLQPAQLQQQKKNQYWKWVVRAGIAASITVVAAGLLFPPILAKRSQATAAQGDLRMIDEDVSRIEGEPAPTAGSSGKDALAAGWASQPGAVRGVDELKSRNRLFNSVDEYTPSGSIVAANPAPARQASNLYLPQSVTEGRGEHGWFSRNAPIDGVALNEKSDVFFSRTAESAPEALVKTGSGTLNLNRVARADDAEFKARDGNSLSDYADITSKTTPAEPYSLYGPLSTNGRVEFAGKVTSYQYADALAPSNPEPSASPLPAMDPTGQTSQSPIFATAANPFNDEGINLKSLPQPVTKPSSSPVPGAPMAMALSMPRVAAPAIPKPQSEAPKQMSAAKPPAAGFDLAQTVAPVEELRSDLSSSKGNSEGEVRDRIIAESEGKNIAFESGRRPTFRTELSLGRERNSREGVTKSGSDTVAINGANTYTGTTDVNGGSLSALASPTARVGDKKENAPISGLRSSDERVDFSDGRRKGEKDDTVEGIAQRELERRKQIALGEVQHKELGRLDLATVNAEKALSRDRYNKAANTQRQEVAQESEFAEVEYNSARARAMSEVTGEWKRTEDRSGKKTEKFAEGQKIASENTYWDGQDTDQDGMVLERGSTRKGQQKPYTSNHIAKETADFGGFINYGKPIQIDGSKTSGVDGKGSITRSLSLNPEPLKGKEIAEGDKDAQPLGDLDLSIAANRKPAELKGERVEELAVIKITGLEKISKGQAVVKAPEPKPAAMPAPEQKELAKAEPAAPPQKSEPPVPQPEVSTKDNAFSTFSLNVSDVSFKLASASLEKGAMPEVASVRTEEFINALDYRDPQPGAGAPLAFAAERARYPFAHNRDLLRLSVKTAAAGREPGRPLNLVLLLDNSGSMERADRVRILKESLNVLTKQLKPQDKLSIITFSRTPRLWADGVSAAQAAEFSERVAGIMPEGGTDLSAAMDLGYKTALKHYAVGSVNRVVLLTDGAANLGDVQPAALKAKVETHRKQGVAFDCFGVGWEGYNDDLLEQLSRNGDGRYGFINSPEAASTEFAAQLAGALRVAASDVKVQVEFNPARVKSYRQLGYAKHQLKKEQFRDNTVDAAEIGAAESGNALYAIEVNPAGAGDIATVRVRFKVPGTSDYREHEWAVPFNAPAPAIEQSSSSLRLAATAGAFAELLAQSPFAAEVSTDKLLGMISGIPSIYGADPRPAKLEWMIRQAKNISGR